jgi:hypothetical protein
MSRFVPFIIVFFNVILRKVITALARKIGLYTLTEEITFIKRTVFIAQFINTAFLILLVSANFHDIRLWWLPFHGQYPDMTYEWYNDIAASLIITMFFNAFTPIIKFVFNYAVQNLRRCYDRGCTRDKYKTK